MLTGTTDTDRSAARTLVAGLRSAGWRHSVERTGAHDVHRWRRHGQVVTAWMDSCGLDSHLLFEGDEGSDGGVVVTRDWIYRYGMPALRDLALTNHLLDDVEAELRPVLSLYAGESS